MTEKQKKELQKSLLSRIEKVQIWATPSNVEALSAIALGVTALLQLEQSETKETSNE